MTAIINIQTGEIIGKIYPWDQFTEARRYQIPWSGEKLLEAIDEANQIGKEHYSSSEAWKEYQDNHTAEECEQCIDDVIFHYQRYHVHQDEGMARPSTR